MTKTTLFNRDWQFFLDSACGQTLPEKALWQNVTLPYDWQIWDVSNLYGDGTGWYRKQFSITREKGIHYAVYFEGVYQNCTVFLNGQEAGSWKNGYSSFYLDITAWVKDGENEIMVRCMLRHPNSRWYSGAGIYRDVWLWAYPELHLLPHGLYISAKEGAEDLWQVSVCAEAAVRDSLPENSCVEFWLYAPDGSILDIHQIRLSSGRPVEEEEKKRFFVGDIPILRVDGCFTLSHPLLWCPNEPVLYRIRARLMLAGQETDHVESSFGCRTLEFSPQNGFFLNHQKMVIHGACLHHDLGCLGAAFSKAAARRQLKLLMEMGVNALRTAHNMPAPAILDLADELGLLVMDESFDCWRLQKTPYDYHLYFSEWFQKDVASWIRRDRNHPCVFLWSIGNEIYDTHAGQEGLETLTCLRDEVLLHDPKKNAAVTFASNYLAWENTQRAADELKIVGYNYGEALYENHRAAHPDWVIYGSETGSTVQSRDIFHFPLSQNILSDDDLQCSDLGNSRSSFGAKSCEECASADEKYPWSLGQFIWSGFDYIGEPSPYHTKNSYFGQIDTAGFAKESFYRYQAAWSKHTVLRLLPYWDFNPSQTVDVCALTNEAQAELFVNGISQGKKQPCQRRAVWRIPYTPGEIMAVVYDSLGKELAREIRPSFTDAVSLSLTQDKDYLLGDGRDLVFFTISALDESGRPVSNANQYVRVHVSGPAVLVGMDNGDSTDQDPYKTNVRQLFSGRLLAVIAGRPEGGEAVIEAESPGMKSVRIPFYVTPCPPSEFFPPMPVQDHPLPDFVPVRKIELTGKDISPASQTLNPEQPSCEIHARIFPQNASDPKLTWRVTDELGLDSFQAKIEILNEDASRIRLTAIGDGLVTLRCMCHNNRPQPQVISILDFTIQGMGAIHPSPYSYLSAAWYSRSEGDIGSGNERGITTSRTDTSWVAYQDLDFGRIGANTLTMDIFELTGDPTPIRFWQGIPYEKDSLLLGERIYHHSPIWNVYQAECFTLDRILTGSTTFAIELHRKIHLKGFLFHRRSRAWDSLKAVQADAVFGDSYTIQTDVITRIGNNVSLVYRDMDFGEKGCAGIVLRGRSPLADNTIHLLFRSRNPEEGQDENTRRRVIEFSGCEEWEEKEFSLEPIYGMQEVTFLFLPGSCFDLDCFRFKEALE
ncbi:MAG: DUF4982 domain-containing protein [Blautia sp.]|nr:DUF4982 domain-containing protein [Blautia sp.]